MENPLNICNYLVSIRCWDSFRPKDERMCVCPVLTVVVYVFIVAVSISKSVFLLNMFLCDSLEVKDETLIRNRFALRCTSVFV